MVRTLDRKDRRMEAPSLRERNIEARRRRILEAARILIERGGVSGFSMRKLASEAGLSVTTLYNLFGAREDILDAMIEDAVDRMIEALDLESTLDDPIARSFAVIEVSVREFGRHEALYRPMMVAGFASRALVAGADRRIAHRAVGLQHEALAAALEQGLLRSDADPLRLGEQIYHGYEFACAQWAYGRLDLDGFEARALYGLVLALQAVGEPNIQPALSARRLELESRLEKSESRPPRRPRRRTRS